MNGLLSAIRERPALLLPLWMLAASLVLFVLMGLDKRRARRGAWRVPEKTLFFAALLFGAPGGLLGMRAFRHKTKHASFLWGFSLLTLVQLALCVWLLWRSR